MLTIGTDGKVRLRKGVRDFSPRPKTGAEFSRLRTALGLEERGVLGVGELGRFGGLWGGWEEEGCGWDCGVVGWRLEEDFGVVFGSASKPTKKSGASRASRAETARTGHPFTESRLLPI